VVALRQARVRDDELAAVQDVMRDQAVAERLHRDPELLVLGCQLVQRLGQTV
jgi:hypothetical protein